MVLDSISRYMSYVNTFVKVLICLGVVGLSACADSGSSSTPAPDSNQGVPENPDIVEYARGAINGRDWKYVNGRAVPFRRNNKTYLEIRLWNELYDNPCLEPVGSVYQVRIYALFEKGSWKIDPKDPFTLIPTIIFSDYSRPSNSRQNLIADQGVIALRAIQSDVLTGVVQGRFTTGKQVGATHVYGRFSVPLCTPLFGSD
ncbi:hypothetical protein [Bdellovibrio sp. HCB209]|uniref:hypothetical protein n=1 Tax=Bdellovibrio sp. HCB209 TaxID=3394354 RepID=UPI0039B3BA74